MGPRFLLCLDLLYRINVVPQLVWLSKHEWYVTRSNARVESNHESHYTVFLKCDVLNEFGRHLQSNHLFVWSIIDVNGSFVRHNLLLFVIRYLLHVNTMSTDLIYDSPGLIYHSIPIIQDILWSELLRSSSVLSTRTYRQCTEHSIHLSSTRCTQCNPLFTSILIFITTIQVFYQCD